MIRNFHGCEIESLPDCTEPGSDGWKHIVRRGDIVVAETITLGLAISVAKGAKALVEHLQGQIVELVSPEQAPAPKEHESGPVIDFDNGTITFPADKEPTQ